MTRGCARTAGWLVIAIAASSTLVAAQPPVDAPRVDPASRPPAILETQPPSGPPPGATTAPQGKPTAHAGQQNRIGEPRAVPQGFSVVLVLAELTASSTQDDVPPAARRALADMKDFLPYKSYRLLDAAWLLGQGSLQTTRLRGVDDQDYELRLVAQPHAPSGRVSVQFSLRDGGQAEAADAERAVTTAATDRTRRQELARLESELRAARARKDEARIQSLEKDSQILQAQIAEAQRSREHDVVTYRKSMPSRAVIDTSFTMDVGETVVVGTSRLRGNSRALIALLTAVPSKGTRPPSEAR